MKPTKLGPIPMPEAPPEPTIDELNARLAAGYRRAAESKPRWVADMYEAMAQQVEQPSIFGRLLDERKAQRDREV